MLGGKGVIVVKTVRAIVRVSDVYWMCITVDGGYGTVETVGLTIDDSKMTFS